jgi:PAS domain S-box-containing protein
MDFKSTPPPDPKILRGGGLTRLPMLRQSLLALLLVILATIGCLVGSRWFERYLVGKQRMFAVTLLSAKGYALSAAIDRRFALMEGLHAFTEANSSAADFGRRFDAYAAGLHAGARDIRLFAIAPGGVIRYIYPVQGNERAIGLDLFRDSHTREDALRTLRNRGTTLSSPYELRQQGLGIVARKAVFAEGRFWGFATMVIDIPSILAEAGLERHDRFDMALRDRSGRAFYGDVTIFDKSPVLLRIDLPEGDWQLAAIPKGGWEASIRRDLLLFRGTSFFVALCLAFIIFQIYDRQRRLSTAVQERTLALQQSENYNRALFELSPTGLALCRMNGVLVDVNPAFADILGRTVEETLGLTYWEVTPEKYAEQERAQLESLQTAGCYGPYEKEFLKKDGRLIPVRLQGRIIERNNEDFIWSSVMDISGQKHAAEMLKKNASLLAETEHLAKVGGWEYDVENGAVVWTDEVYCIHEVTPGSHEPDDIGRDLRFYPAPGGEAIEEAFNLAVTQGTAFDLELPFVSAKGRHLWVRTIGKPIAEGNKIVRVVGNIMDITERKRLEEVLKERNQQLSLFAEHSPAAIAMLDRDMKYLIVSERWREDYDLGDREVIGRSHFEIFPEAPGRWRELYQRCMAGEIERSQEDHFVRADGSVEWIQWEMLPWYASTGDIGGIIIFTENITERKQAEAAIKREHDFSEVLIDSLPGIMYLYDQDFNFLRWNKNFERALGYTAEEIVELGPLDFFAATDKELVRSKIQEVLATGASTVEAGFVSKSGVSTPFFFTGTRTEIDGKTCLIGIGIDISQRKRLEEELTALNVNLETRVAERTHELQQSRLELVKLVEDLNEKRAQLVVANEKLKEIDRLKSMFIASMSHELRTPLNSVIGYSSIIMNEWLGPLDPKQKENLAIVLRAGKHLLSLINDVIDVSKIEAGQIEVYNEEFDLFDLVAEAAQQLEPEIRGKGLAFSVLNAHLTLLADRRRLLQAILNLLSNAMKYTVEGSIRLAVNIDSAWVEIVVADTGIGIGAEDAKLVFQPFQRLNSPLKGTVSGTGLGLYLTNKLVSDVLGGSITFVSAVGKGSTFTIRVPVTVGAVPETEPCMS